MPKNPAYSFLKYSEWGDAIISGFLDYLNLPIFHFFLKWKIPSVSKYIWDSIVSPYSSVNLHDYDLAYVLDIYEK